MNRIKYIYNAKTCRYEVAPLLLWSLSGKFLAILLLTGLILSGMLFLHSKLFESPQAKALRKENAAIRKHHSVLENTLRNVEANLQTLESQEASLAGKLFGYSLISNHNQKSDEGYKEEILLADASDFYSELESLKSKASLVISRSTYSNRKFRELHFTERDVNFIMSIPSIQPVSNPEGSNLVSGFGNRINPFHKGMHHHPGADFAAARGTAVYATGNGRIIEVVKNSTLQAGYGNYIEINHGNGVVSKYAHLDEVYVKIGQKVPKGFVIGTVGMTGGTVAPHVHYEIHRKGIQVNPVPYMMEHLTGEQYNVLLSLNKKQNQSLD
jgi:murein DD-endopeptidase MepM/ murein hydrolase activator NlpD